MDALQLLLLLLLIFVPTPLLLLTTDEGDSMGSGVAAILEPRFFEARPLVLGALFVTTGPLLGLLLLLQIPPPLLLPSIECDLQREMTFKRVVMKAFGRKKRNE